MYLTGYIFGCGSMVLLDVLKAQGYSSAIQIIGLIIWCALGSTVNSWVKKYNEKNH